jgi:simple sugar transport system substrate-binding protein
MDDSWVPEDHWGGIDEDMIQIIGLSDRLSEEQSEAVNQVIDAIGAGELHPFTGPLKDQAGELKVADGVTMTEQELAGMNWFVEGVGAALPQ